MCGIVGMAGNLYPSHNKMFRDMLLFDTVRGVDSTGVFHINSKDEISWVKNVGLPDNIFGEKQQDLLNSRGVPNHTGKVLVGHNRAATMGSITTDNAHPFEFENVVGVHNGSLYSTEGLYDEKKYDVDSQAIYSDINKNSIKDTWSKLNGPATLCWWDNRDQTINFIRNSERPLFYAYNEKKDVIFWASEFWMIRVAAERNKISLLTTKNEDGSSKIVYYDTTVNKHYKIVPTMYNFEMTTETLTPLEKKSYSSSYSSLYSNHPYNSYYKGYKNYTIVKPKKVKKSKSEPMNSSWAKGFEKGVKGTRGLLFKFVGTGGLDKEQYIVGEILNSGYENTYLKIFPKDTNDLNKLFENLYSDIIFTTTARTRIAVVDDRILHHRISSVHIKEAKNNQLSSVKTYLKTIIKTKKDEEPTLTRLYNGPDNKMVSYVEIKESLNRIKNCCTSCGNVVDVNDKLNWYGKNVLLCETCNEDELIRSCVENGVS